MIWYNSYVYIWQFWSCQIVGTLWMESTDIIQIFNIINWLCQNLFCHFLKMRINIEFCFKNSFLASIIKWASIFLLFWSKMTKIFIKISFVSKIGSFNNIFNKNLFLIFFKIFFISFHFSSFQISLFHLSGRIVHCGLLRLLFLFLNIITFLCGSIHDSH